MLTSKRHNARALCTVLVFCAVLFGCGRREANPGVVHIRFWHAWGGYEGMFLQSLIDEFNASHPKIHVDGSYFTIGDKLLASIAGGKPPDVATVWSYMLVPMGESGAFLPLDEFLMKDHITRSDYLPNVWDYGLYGKHRWGIPSTLNTMAIFYNTKLVREAGLDPSHPPATTDELARWGKKLTRKSANGRMLTLGYVPVQSDFWFPNFGGRMFDPEKKEFVLNSSQNIETIEWMKGLVDVAGGMDAYRRFSASFGKLDSPQNPIFTGKLAMKEDGQWLIQFFRNYAPDVEYGVFPFPPAHKDIVSHSTMSGSFWTIPVGTRHPHEAWTFLAWLSAPEQIGRFCAKLNNIPPRRAALDVPAFAEMRKDPKFEFFVKLIADGHAIPQETTPVSEQLYDQLNDGSQAVFSGTISAKGMLNGLNEKMNAELIKSEKFNE
jgi:multiple sugar transport system substrate-binding protein